jgi:hypothetical protein
MPFMYGFRRMTIPEFIAKWRKVELKERSAAQEHFIDLCNAFDQPTPAAADPSGVNFCFEKGAAKHGGGDGFADVWKRGFFGWEYKGKHKDLSVAYDQLLRYRNALENPPLLVVCDLDRIIVHTNFTGTVSVANVILLESLAEPRNIEILRAVFHNPEALRPGRTSAAVTQDAARHFAVIAAAMRERGLDSAVVAHFLDRLVFCLFSEDVRLLPDMVFTRIVEKSGGDPARFCKILGQLFDTMATGGILTMLSAPGSGTLAGNAHQDTFLQIAKADAITLAGILQNAIDVPLLAEYFPGQPALAYFEFSPGLTHATSRVVQDALDLKAAGLEIDTAELSEKTGYTLTKTPASSAAQ